MYFDRESLLWDRTRSQQTGSGNEHYARNQLKLMVYMFFNTLRKQIFRIQRYKINIKSNYNF